MSGDYLVAARVLDPVSQDWLQLDPSGFKAGDPNLYRYVSNNPVNATDPSGLISLSGLWSEVTMIGSYVWNDPTGAANAFHDGASDGALMVYNAATNGRDAAVNNYVNEAIAQNGPAYAFANTMAQIGVESGKMALQMGIGAGVSSLATRALGSMVGCGAPAIANLGLGFVVGAGSDAIVQTAMMGLGLQDNFSVGQMLFAGTMGAANQYLGRACFSGDTELLARGWWGQGFRRIDEIGLFDEVLSRDENDPKGPLAWKRVEELFQRTGRILHLRVDGHLIRTTPEHPFYAIDKGWVEAGGIEVGDLLLSHNGQMVCIDEVYDTGEYQTVYNLRAEDWHTYFVGGDDWGFSVWAHNYNQWGQHGTPSHKNTVQALVAKANGEFSGQNVVIQQGKSILAATGINRRPDVSVWDGVTGQVLKVYEAARTNGNGFVPRELLKRAEYVAAGIASYFKKVV